MIVERERDTRQKGKCVKKVCNILTGIFENIANVAAQSKSKLCSRVCSIERHPALISNRFQNFANAMHFQFSSSNLQILQA